MLLRHSRNSKFPPSRTLPLLAPSALASCLWHEQSCLLHVKSLLLENTLTTLLRILASRADILLLTCTYILSISIHLQNFIKSYQLVHKILNINQNFDINKGHYSVENERKMLFNHPNLHFVNINAYTQFDRNPQINSQDNEHKLATISKNFKINLEGQNYVHFYVKLSRNVKIFGIMASL